MNPAFNRDRKDQIVTRVMHPRLDVEFKRIKRQTLAKAEKLYNLASYFSAYKVPPNLVDNLEALLIRAFPNDVTNVKMQRIRRKKTATKQSSKRIKTE